MANPVTHLEKTIAGEVNPVTHLEKVIAEYGGGGGGGTSDYTDLTNKPKINNVELTGNKSLADLGAATQSDMTTVENNILLSLDANGKKNYFNYSTINDSGATHSVSGNTITISGRSNWAKSIVTISVSSTGRYIFTCNVSAITSQKSGIQILQGSSEIGKINNITTIGNVSKLITVTNASENIKVAIIVNDRDVLLESDASITIENVMLCPEELYSISSTYQPFAMTNVELTAAIQAIQAQIANQ